MNREAFLRALRRYARLNNLTFGFDASKGKGGHGEVEVAERFTYVKTGQLSKVYVQVVLKQLGLPKNALDDQS